MLLDDHDRATIDLSERFHDRSKFVSLLRDAGSSYRIFLGLKSNH